jgi:hypothetical protein
VEVGGRGEKSPKQCMHILIKKKMIVPNMERTSKDKPSEGLYEGSQSILKVYSKRFSVR